MSGYAATSGSDATPHICVGALSCSQTVTIPRTPHHIHFSATCFVPSQLSAAFFPRLMENLAEKVRLLWGVRTVELRVLMDVPSLHQAWPWRNFTVPES